VEGLGPLGHAVEDGESHGDGGEEEGDTWTPDGVLADHNQ
jgi:hypothetical protein